MSTLLEELSEKALSLSIEERAQFAQELLASVEREMDPEVDAAWDAEIARRTAEIESGAVKLIASEDVHAAARRHYQK